jgi:hypothetical protein
MVLTYVSIHTAAIYLPDGWSLAFSQEQALSHSPSPATGAASSSSSRWHRGRRWHGVVVGVLDRQTHQGGTRGGWLRGEDCDRETENLKVCTRTRDTRFIQVWAAKVANPTSCLGIKYGVMRLVLVEIRCPARYLALLYIVQGVGS